MARGLRGERTSQGSAACMSGVPTSQVMDAAIPLEDPRDEVVRVLAAATEERVVLRAVGGLAVYLRCPSARVPPLARDYKDIDLVGRSGDAPKISELLRRLGYLPDETIVMSHELRIGARLDLDDKTITLADLLLTKLQVVEINERDLGDAAALLADHDISPDGIDPERITTLLSSDWGWWRTVSANLERIASYADSLSSFEGASRVKAGAAELRRRIDEVPKTLRWKLRARVGERVRWYELPEELEA
jgi:hypothetical protein